MKHWVACMVFLVFLPTSVWAQEEAPVLEQPDPVVLAQPIVNATVPTPSPAWIGQMVQVRVQLLRDMRGDNGKPFFGETSVRGGMVQLANFLPIAGTQTIDGVEYLEQVRVYQVFPQYGETMEFPPIEVSWFEGDERKSAVSKPVTIALKTQDGIPDGAWLASPRATLTQTVAGDVDTFRVGDAITRTVTIEATDTDAMMLPPIQFEDIPGMTRYVAEPRLSTSSTRGEFVATRIDRVTYVANRWGFYQLPPIRIAWFEPSSGTFQELVAEPVAFRARLNPELGVSCIGTAESVPRGTVWVLLLVVVAAIGWRWHRSRTAVQTVEVAPDLEPVRFKALIDAVKQGDAKATVNAAHAWFGERAQNPVTIERFANPDPDLTANVEALEAMVVGQSQTWQPSKFEQGVKALRHPKKDAEGALPPLNP